MYIWCIYVYIYIYTIFFVSILKTEFRMSVKLSSNKYIRNYYNCDRSYFHRLPYFVAVDMNVQIQVEAHLQKQLSDHLHFRQESAAQTLTISEMKRITVIPFEFALVTPEPLWEGFDLNL